MVGSTNAPLASTPFHQQPLPVCTFHVSIMKRRKLRDTAPLFPWGKHFHMLANESTLLPSLRHLFSQAPKHIDFDTPSETFIWDVLERNIMIDDGVLTGFVDQDGLMTGDIIQVPAAASVYLDMKGFSFTQSYVRAWMDRWDANEFQWERFRWYRASFGLFQESRSGQREASGRIKPAVCRKKLASWVDEALRFS